MKTDLTYLRGMSGGNNGIIKEMIDLFIEQVVEISEAMDIAMASKDYIALGKLAHKAKSSIAIMGMNELAAELKSLELNAAAGLQLDSYESIVKKFKSDCSIAIEELNLAKNSN